MPAPILGLLNSISRAGRRGGRRSRAGGGSGASRSLAIATAAARRARRLQNLTSQRALNFAVAKLTKQLERSWFNRSERITQDPPTIGPIFGPARAGARRYLRRQLNEFKLSLRIDPDLRVNIGVTWDDWLTIGFYNRRDPLVNTSGIRRQTFFNRYFVLLSLYDPYMALMAAYAVHGPSGALAFSYLSALSLREILGASIAELDRATAGNDPSREDRRR